MRKLGTDSLGIVRAIQDAGRATARQVADMTGLTTAQVDQRVDWLKRAGHVHSVGRIQVDYCKRSVQVYSATNYGQSSCVDLQNAMFNIVRQA